MTSCKSNELRPFGLSTTRPHPLGGARFGCWGLALLIMGASCQALAGDDPEHGWESVTATWDNDLFTRSNTDRHYTNGVHVRLESRPFAAFDEATTPALFLPVLKALPVSSEAFQRRTLAYSFGQKMFTPDDITLATPQPNDLPYAGLLYAAADFNASAPRHADLFRLTLGLVGPWSLAEQTQKAAHKLVGADEPRGWDHQLGNEIVFSALYERRHLLASGKLGGHAAYDLVGIGRGEVGTLNTGAEASIAVVLGESGTNGHRRLQPAVAGNGYLFRNDLRQGWFGYLGATGRLTLHNVFLDGNTFRDSPSVDRKPVSGGVFFGLGFAAQGWTASLGWNLESKRFETQEKGVRYGSLTFMYRFD